MKRARGLLTLLLVLVFTISLLGGCGSGSSAPGTTEGGSAVASTQGNATQTASSEAFKDHYEISFALWDIEQSFPKDKEDKLRAFIENKFNITIKPVNITWDDYMEKIQVWAASSQLPDVFAIDARTQQFYSSWVTQGVVKPIPDDMSKYPNLQKMLEMKDIQAYKDPDGKYYGIPRQAYSKPELYPADKGIKIRKDWMEKVGMPNPPQNWDEFIALMKAFAEKDPDGNGQNDTVGITAWDRSFLLNLLLSSSVPTMAAGANKWIKEDGRWIPTAFSKNMIPALQLLKRLWDSGGMDKDMAILKGTEGEDKFCSGKAGAYARGTVFYPSETEKLKKTYPDKKLSDYITILKPWPAPDGKIYRYEDITPWSETYFPAALDNKKFDRVLALFDWMISQEGQDYFHYGFEGVDYKRNGDQIEITRPKDSTGVFVPLGDLYPIVKTFSTMVTWDQDFQFLNDPSKDPDQRAIEQEAMNYNLAPDKVGLSTLTDFRFSFLNIPDKDKETMLPQDEIMKAIMSDDVEKTWNEIIQGFLKNGYDKVIQEYNDAALAAGIK